MNLILNLPRNVVYLPPRSNFQLDRSRLLSVQRLGESVGSGLKLGYLCLEIFHAGRCFGACAHSFDFGAENFLGYGVLSVLAGIALRTEREGSEYTYIPAFDCCYAAICTFEVCNGHIHFSEFRDYFLVYVSMEDKSAQTRTQQWVAG
jgi:hypothetical protein